jgi:hypothetical protein
MIVMTFGSFAMRAAPYFDPDKSEPLSLPDRVLDAATADLVEIETSTVDSRPWN